MSKRGRDDSSRCPGQVKKIASEDNRESTLSAGSSDKKKGAEIKSQRGDTEDNKKMEILFGRWLIRDCKYSDEEKLFLDDKLTLCEIEDSPNMYEIFKLWNLGGEINKRLARLLLLSKYETLLDDGEVSPYGLLHALKTCFHVRDRFYAPESLEAFIRVHDEGITEAGFIAGYNFLEFNRRVLLKDHQANGDYHSDEYVSCYLDYIKDSARSHNEAALYLADVFNPLMEEEGSFLIEKSSTMAVYYYRFICRNSFDTAAHYKLGKLYIYLAEREKDQRKKKVFLEQAFYFLRCPVSHILDGGMSDIGFHLSELALSGHGGDYVDNNEVYALMYLFISARADHEPSIVKLATLSRGEDFEQVDPVFVLAKAFLDSFFPNLQDSDSEHELSSLPCAHCKDGFCNKNSFCISPPCGHVLCSHCLLKVVGKTNTNKCPVCENSIHKLIRIRMP